MMTGVVDGEPQDRAFLEELGVKILGVYQEPYDVPHPWMSWTVEMTDEVFEKLHDHWGRFIWTLDHV